MWVAGFFLLAAFPVARCALGSNGQTSVFSSVYCFDSTRCLAVGGSGSSGRLALTTDGGARWKVRSVREVRMLNAITCNHRDVCLAVGDVTVGSRAQGSMLRSNDGGTSWQRVSSLPVMSISSLRDVACSGDLCLAGGYTGTGVEPDCALAAVRSATCTDQLNGVGQRAVMLASSDEGKHWRSSSSLPSSVSEIDAVQCPAPATCVAAGDRLASPGAFTGAILHSSDYGSTWTFGSVPASVTTEQGGFSDLTCWDSIHCMAAGWFPGFLPHSPVTPDSQLVANQVVATTDGGKSWNTIGLPERLVGANLGSLDCSPNGSCIIDGSPFTSDTASMVDDLFTTSNGGNTWSTPYQIRTYSLSDSITCAQQTCVGVGLSGLSQAATRSGGRGAIIYSRDSGSTWAHAELSSQ